MNAKTHRSLAPFPGGRWRLANAGLLLAIAGGVVAGVQIARPDPLPQIDPVPDRREPGEFRIVALGTSLTARGGWQAPLAAMLQRCLRRPVRLLTVAHSGATSRWGVAAVPLVRERQPDVVLVEFAANDAALDRWMPLSTSAANMASIVSVLVRSKGTPRVIVMAMNPAAGLRGALRPRLDAYADAQLAAGRRVGADTLDHRSAWRGLTPGQRRAVIPDGLHPRPQSAAAIIAPAIARRLAPQGCRAA